MFYRVTTILTFTEEDEARDFFHDADLALPKSQNINPSKENAERCFILLERCYHDQDPTIPCVQLAYDTVD